jgi:hypothetical protein
LADLGVSGFRAACYHVPRVHRLRGRGSAAPSIRACRRPPARRWRPKRPPAHCEPRHETGCPVDGRAEIVPVAYLNLAGGQPHPHPNGGLGWPGVASKRRPGAHRRRDRVTGAGERHREPIPPGRKPVAATAFTAGPRSSSWRAKVESPAPRAFTTTMCRAPGSDGTPPRPPRSASRPCPGPAGAGSSAAVASEVVPLSRSSRSLSQGCDPHSETTTTGFRRFRRRGAEDETTAVAALFVGRRPHPRPRP